MKYSEQEIKDGIKLAFEVIGYFDVIDFEKHDENNSLVEEYGLDSIDVVELVLFLEDSFEIEITDEEFYTALVAGYKALIELIQDEAK